MKYRFTTENIKFPSFHNTTLSETLSKPVTSTSIIEELSAFHQSVCKVDANYSKLIKENRFDLSNRLLQAMRGVNYYSAAIEGLKRIITILSTKIKAQFSMIDLQSDHSSSQINLTSNSMISSSIDRNHSNTNDAQILNELLAFQSNNEHRVLASNKRVGLCLISSSMKYGMLILEATNEQISKYTQLEVFSGTNSELILMDLILYFDNVIVITIAFYNAYFINEKDIFNLDEESEAWARMKKVMQRVVVNDQIAFIKETETMKAQSQMMLSVLSRGFTSASNVKNFFSSIYSAVVFSYLQEEKLLEYKKLYAKQNDQLFLESRKIATIPYIKKLMSVTYTSIAYRKKVYMKRNEREITLDYINQILEHYKDNPDKPFLYKENDINANDATFLEKTDINQKPNYVSTRLIHSSKLYLKNDKPPLLWNLFNNKDANLNQTNNSLMIYIHGGGFISGSAYGSERFTRHWVNKLKIPLIGINYRLSPESQYPKAVDDVWQAYNWIITNAQDQLNINPQHIIISGDSAGGSICLSLIYLLIIHNVRLPELVIPFYPCCDQDPKGMSLSQLLVMQDSILNYKAMEFFNRAYVGRDSNVDDFVNNQAKAPKEVLVKLPKVRFFIGSSDPLRDGSIRVIDKMAEAGVDCKAYEFMDYYHAFLSFAGKLGKEVVSSIFYKEIIEHLKSVNVAIE